MHCTNFCLLPITHCTELPTPTLPRPQCLFRRLSDEAGEAILESLAVLVRGMFSEAVTYCQRIELGEVWKSAYAGARVVFRNVDLQILHWISLACSLTLSCDFATLVSLSLRSRLEAALAPCCAVVSSLFEVQRDGGVFLRFPFLRYSL
jgi:hypothetical protein